MSERKYDRDYLPSPEKRNQIMELWVVQKFGADPPRWCGPCANLWDAGNRMAHPRHPVTCALDPRSRQYSMVSSVPNSHDPRVRWETRSVSKPTIVRTSLATDRIIRILSVLGISSHLAVSSAQANNCCFNPELSSRYNSIGQHQASSPARDVSRRIMSLISLILSKGIVVSSRCLGLVVTYDNRTTLNTLSNVTVTVTRRDRLQPPIKNSVTQQIIDATNMVNEKLSGIVTVRSVIIDRSEVAAARTKQSNEIILLGAWSVRIVNAVALGSVVMTELSSFSHIDVATRAIKRSHLLNEHKRSDTTGSTTFEVTIAMPIMIRDVAHVAPIAQGPPR